jgi:hypothetical protein
VKDLPPAFRVLPSGGDLLDQLTSAFSDRQGWIQATGFVEDVELRLTGTSSEVRRVFPGQFTLVALGGPLGGPYGATLSRLENGSVSLLAGVLVRARSREVTAMCIGSSAPRVDVAPPALPAPPATKPATKSAMPVNPARPPGGSNFASRVGAAAALSDEEDAAGSESPERGDLVQHFAFGLCEVLSAAGERLVLRDAGGNGRIREVAIDRLAVTGPVEHDGKRLFRLERR